MAKDIPWDYYDPDFYDYCTEVDDESDEPDYEAMAEALEEERAEAEAQAELDRYLNWLYK